MIRPNTTHSLIVAGFVAICGFAVNRSSFAKDRVQGAMPSDLKVVSELKPGNAFPTGCTNGLTGNDCLAVPVAVARKDAQGNPTTVVTSYPVGPDLVEKIKNDFGAAANVVLRQIRPMVQKASENSDAGLETQLALEKIDAAVPYRVQPGVKLPIHIEQKVAMIAKKAFERSGHPIVVTSGTRTPESQAEAIRTKLSMGDNVTRLYANKRAVSSIVKAYKTAKHLGADDETVTEQMAEVIEKQVDKGVYISRHLRAGAVDIRTRDLDPQEKHELMAAIRETPGVAKALVESTPPHLHLELQ